MQDTLLQQGLTLMLTGMGTVFVFLTLLVVTLNIMSRVLALLPEEEVPAQSHRADPGDEVAAIAAAIHRHRALRKD